jgi:MoaA/NifB/PqqE/SkfB family radical SAM enzyme
VATWVIPFIRELGSILTAQDQVTFSVDGWDQQSNEQYRVNCDFASIVSGIQTLRQTSLSLIVWSAIYFTFNEDRMMDIQSLAQSLGVDCFQTVHSSKFGGRYNINGIDPLQPQQVAATAQYEKSLESFTGRMPQHRNYSRPAHAWARCLRHEKELLITATGLVLPCPWFNSGYQQNSFVSQYSERLNVKTRSLNEVLTDPVWQELRGSFNSEPLPICKIKCKDCK